MNYYKIMIDNNIIGAVASKNFMNYDPITQCFFSSNETEGEYVSWRGRFYRDTWMQPYQINVDYISARIIGVEESEYNALYEALKVQEYVTPETNETSIDIDLVIDTTSIDFIKKSKILEMSTECKKTIEAGFDMILHGNTCHFSLSTQDQLNLMNLNLMTQTEELIPYHADGEECEFYTSTEINEIIAAATNFKNYQTAYYNSLKIYINALDTIEAIAAIEYGTPIPDEYKSDVLRVLE